MLLLVFSGFWLSGAAQQSQQSLLGAGGGHAQTDSYLIDWSLGEAVIETAASSTGVYTQGFLQPFLIKRKRTGLPEGATLQATVAPNPAYSQVTVSFSAHTKEPLTLWLHNAVGVALLQLRIPQGSRQLTVNTAGLAQGSYLVSVRNNAGALVESFNIIKLH